MEILGKIPEWLKLPPSALLGVVLVTASLLFLPSSVLTALGVAVLAEQYRMWIGLAFLVALVLLVMSVIGGTGPWVRDGFRRCAERRGHIKRLKSLTPDEKVRLRGYVTDNTRTQRLMPDGVTAGLRDAGIVYSVRTRLSIQDIRDPRSDYNLQEWAWEHLRKHPHLVDVDGV